MKLYGMSMVRNEADIIRANVLYHLSTGFDRLLIIDNGSSDGTDGELRRLAVNDPRVVWRRDARPYRQAETHKELLVEAYREGADWVVPIDADEFWHAPSGNLRSILERCSANSLEIERMDFIQRREQRKPSPDSILHMTRRVPETISPANGESNRQLVESHQASYVQLRKPPKLIYRPSPTVQVAEGNHALRNRENLSEKTGEILCLHAPLRSRASLDHKVQVAARRDEAGYKKPGQSWHLRRWRRLQAEEKLDQEWEANSYSDTTINVYGVQCAVIFDPTLRDLLSPWLPPDHSSYQPQDDLLDRK